MLSLINDKLNALSLRAKTALTEERGEVNIVAIVLLIVVAVSLVFIFKEQIGDFLTRIFDDIGSNNPDDFKV